MSSSVSAGRGIDMLLRVLMCRWSHSLSVGSHYSKWVDEVLVPCHLHLSWWRWYWHCQSKNSLIVYCLQCCFFLGGGELGVDVEKDVLVSMSVWLAENLDCWSFMGAVWSRYWLTVCGMVVVWSGWSWNGAMKCHCRGCQSWNGATSWCWWLWNVAWGCRAARPLVCCVIVWNAGALWSWDVTRCYCFHGALLWSYYWRQSCKWG